MRPRQAVRRAASGLLALAALVIGACSEPSAAEPLRVLAAASAAPVVDAIVASLERDRGVCISVSYAASGTLARQIELGAPAHVFISAHPEWLAWLDEADLVGEGPRPVLFRNTLVLAAPAGRAPALRDGWLPDGIPAPRLVTGDPEHVPLGRYARQALQSAGVWDGWAEHLLTTSSAPAAARLLALGEADLGIVFGSAVRERIDVLRTLDPASHDPIEYRAAPIAPHVGAEAFLAAFTTPEGRAVVTREGFVP